MAFLSSTPFIALLYKILDAHFLVLILFLMNDDMLISSSFHQMLLTFKIPIILLCWSYLQLTFLRWGIAYCVKGGPEKELKAMQVRYFFSLPCSAVPKKLESH